MNIINTKDTSTILSYIRSYRFPNKISHKGQNGKALVIGGSSLFHGAVLWAAEAVSLMTDMVHVASTSETNEIIRSIKVRWQTGIVIPQQDIPFYANEDGVILIGNGMLRTDKIQAKRTETQVGDSWEEVLRIHNEGEFTRACVKYLITHYPHKRFVFDAGALQMMDKEWLAQLEVPAIITPHQEEFHHLFGVNVLALSLEEKIAEAKKAAQRYHAVVLLKAVDDIVTDGVKTAVISGGNAGLTKGGTGDLLGGITAGLYASADAFDSAVVASYLLKKTADSLFAIKGYWYSVHDLLHTFPEVWTSLTSS